MSFLADSKWIHTQKKAFRNWANFYLRQRGLEIQNIDNDLKDGILLINLVEILLGKNLGPYIKVPKLKVQKINNINLAIDAIRKNCEGVQITTSAEEIVEGKLNMILGIIWTMVNEFQIRGRNAGGAASSKPGQTVRDSLLDWIVSELNRSPYKDNINVAAIKTNFTESLKDGKVLNYLVHRRDPNLVNLSDVDNRTPEANLTHALDAAEKHLGIPKLIDVEDIREAAPDEQSLLTYISYFRSTAGPSTEPAPVEAVATREAPPVVVTPPVVVPPPVVKAPETDWQSKYLEEKLRADRLEREVGQLDGNVKSMRSEIEELRRRHQAELDAASARDRQRADEVEKLREENRRSAALLVNAGDANVKNIRRKEQEEIALRDAQIHDLTLQLEAERSGQTKRISRMPKAEVIPMRPKAPATVTLQEEAPREDDAEDEALFRSLTEKVEKQSKEIERITLELEQEQERGRKLQEKPRDAPVVVATPAAVVSVAPRKFFSLEELIRRLHVKRGSAIVFKDLEEEYRENKNLISQVADLRESVDAIIDDMLNNYRDADGKGDAIPREAKHVIDDATRLVLYRQNLKTNKNTFVRACNELGRLYTSKSKNEKLMEEWRKRFMDIQDNRPEECHEGNRELLDNMEEVRDLLKLDDDTFSQVLAKREVRISARNQVQNAMEDLHTHLREKIGASEERRLRNVTRDLKKKNRDYEQTIMEHTTTQTTTQTTQTTTQIAS
eukprot:TRINITY_DN920_c0_g1_i1.p1 TRINITY_DN920_c0_g1~~TRINITY_DN920_c0_g1_i1.p1  ORF type:complete len:746 (-),score=228.81 TRINITY_DN920_c0_g1_i1:85-2271(-)